MFTAVEQQGHFLNAQLTMAGDKWEHVAAETERQTAFFMAFVMVVAAMFAVMIGFVFGAIAAEQFPRVRKVSPCVLTRVFF
jgi:hypothetical protein